MKAYRIPAPKPSEELPSKEEAAKLEESLRIAAGAYCEIPAEEKTIYTPVSWWQRKSPGIAERFDGWKLREEDCHPPKGKIKKSSP